MRGPDAHSNPAEFLEGVLIGEGAVALLRRLAGPPGLAAFDADGTLWEPDIGEEVLRALIADQRLRDPPADPWAEYRRLVRRDPAVGFAYAVKVMRGLSEAELFEVSRRIFADRIKATVFAPVRALIAYLLGRDWDVYVVSASNRWSVAAAVETLGVSASRVLALEVEVEGGVLTDRVREPIPTLEGKVALLKAAVRRSPDLAFGNSVLDVPLLLSAEVPVAVGSVGDHPRNRFLVQAMRRAWARLEIRSAA